MSDSPDLTARFIGCEEMTSVEIRKALSEKNECGSIFYYEVKYSDGNKEDYHDNFNSDLFSKYMREKFSPYLKKPTCIVLDNADYHMEMESGSFEIAQTKNKSCKHD